MKTLCTICFMLLTSLSCFSQPGSIDTSFDLDGMVVTDLGTTGDFANSVIVQPDGKTIVVGNTSSPASADLVIVRYNVDGSLDNTFSTDGIFIEGFNGTEVLNSVALQPDGKIVVAGHITLQGGNTDFLVLRLKSNGVLDQSFKNNGSVLIDIQQGSDFANVIVMASDGRMLIGGSSESNGSESFAFVRLFPDGKPDSTFDGDGIVTTALNGNYIDAVCNSVAIQADGKFFAAGFVRQNGFDSNSAIVRFNNDGSLDASFSGDGLEIVNLGTQFEAFSALAIQNNGKIVACGYAADIASFHRAVLARYNVDGASDTTFNSTGYVFIGADSIGEIGSSVYIQTDGKIILTGGDDYDDFLLFRRNSNGTPDSSFGNNGVVITDPGFTGLITGRSAIAPDGKIVLIGSIFFNNLGFDLIAARYILDNCLSPGSLQTSNITPTSAIITWGPSGESYQYRYKESGTGAWNKGNTVNTFKKIKNLLANTGYVWQVKSKCGSNPNVFSDWSAKQYFITPLRLANTEQSETALMVYPNPVSSSATIQFFLTNSDEIKIELLDLEGRKIRTVAEGNFEAGNHQLNFFAANLPAGIYLLQLRCTSHIESQKLIIH